MFLYKVYTDNHWLVEGLEHVERVGDSLFTHANLQVYRAEKAHITTTGILELTLVSSWQFGRSLSYWYLS
jgi:hypothetical protein